MTAPGAGWTNSSARISTIFDVRGGSTVATYTFNYDSTPHLTSITNSIQDAEAYTFTYSAGQSLTSPINGQSFGTTTLLDTVAVTGLNTTHTFTYNGSGELTQVVVPDGGYLAYQYTSTAYSTGRTYREVLNRYLSKDGTSASQTTYPFTHESSPGQFHQYTKIDDPGGVGEKYWAFATSGLAMGLVTEYQGRQFPGPVAKVENDFTWAQDSVGNSYIASTLTTLDPGQSYQAQKKTNQTVDIYGNVLQVQNYNYGNLSTPARTYNYTYLNSSAYLARYILNRLTLATVTDGTNQVTLGTNTYDIYTIPSGGMAAGPSSAFAWDSANYPATMTTRGNVTATSTPDSSSTFGYDATGSVVETIVNGITTQVTNGSATDYAAPTQLTVGSLTTSLSYSSFLGLTSVTGPNGDVASTQPDQYGRPISTTSTIGVVTTYTYSSPPYNASTPAWSTATTNGHWTKTILDGFGRTSLVQNGYGTGGGAVTVSQTETVYGSWGCVPLGKMTQQAMAHVPNGTPVWTTYTYDGIGRTVSVVSPDGASTITYSYQGNTVTTTDPAGNWKTFTMDAFGNLTQVTEPNPAGGQNYSTSYSYDLWNNLNQVSMPRPTGTQTRNFAYSGSQLVSATNPENGTVSYTYNTYEKVATKTDAKGQQVQYTYDNYARLTQVVHLVPGGGGLTQDPCQTVTYSYDVNPYDGTYSGDYTSGRLVAVQYLGGWNFGTNGSSNCGTTFTDMYDYSLGGETLGKRLQVTRNGASVKLNSTYTYDVGGNIATLRYPVDVNGSGPYLNYTYDSMGRLNTMTDWTNYPTQVPILTGATYGPSNELLSLSGNTAPYLESRTYNANLQLTQLSIQSSPGVYALNISYNFSSTQNNGKVTSQTDSISGEQVVYTYDALNRLASAQATSGTWGQSYGYDGFGNLTSQQVIAGSAPMYTASYNPATNQPIGTTTDANGNVNSGNGLNSYMYDVENRIVDSYDNSGDGFWYSYAPSNQRVWRGVMVSSSITTDEITFWSITGQKLATYAFTQSGSSASVTLTGSNYYFGHKLIKNASGYLTPDRLGSIGKYYPWGQEKPSATQNGTEKFTGYFRDAETGLDYALNRYHNPGTGRFMTPDPYTNSAGATDPGSWNRYAYTRGDPVNRHDPNGTCDEDGGDFTECDGGDGSDGGDGGGGGAPPPGPLPKSFDQLPCWANETNIQETFLDIVGNILSIVDTDPNFTQADLTNLDNTLIADVGTEENQIFTALGNPPGQPVNLAIWNNLSIFSNPIPGTDFNGGHFDLSDVSIAAIASDLGGRNSKAFQDFVKDFKGGFHGKYQNAVSGQAAQQGDALHSHMYTTGNQAGNFTFHFDDYSPLENPISHLAVDVIEGHLPGVCLDPAWH